MKENRIETIVNEIHYWKEHRLLPGEYCDFLLALYTQGQRDSSDRDIEFNNSKRNSLTLMFSTFNPYFVTPFISCHLFY